jgi:hypothetical protein
MSDYIRAKHLRALEICRAKVLACLRCGGSGIYHTYGECFRCGGAGVDPQQPKALAKSKRFQQQQAWAAQFGPDGNPLPYICPFCEHVIDHCRVKVCEKHRAEHRVNEMGQMA